LAPNLLMAAWQQRRAVLAIHFLIAFIVASVFFLASGQLYFSDTTTRSYRDFFTASPFIFSCTGS